MDFNSTSSSSKIPIWPTDDWLANCAAHASALAESAGKQN